jgi:Domain of Unknown Function (DUF1080)
MLLRTLARMSMMLMALLALTCPTGLARAAADFQPEEGFTRLDNVKDLSGWTGDLTGWSVQDGAIHLDARAAKGNIYAVTPHSRNCIIRLQFRASPKADSGVYVHGKQFQVRDYPTAGPKPYAGPCKPAGQWNDLEWDITDGIAVVRLNGEVIEKAWPIGKRAEQGLGLQKETGDFDFRFIRFKEKR